MQKQVDKTHYAFDTYMHQKRWASLWFQLDTVLATHSNTVLEIGPGLGLFKGIGERFGLNITTLDIDPELQPDYVGSVYQLDFEDNSFDCVCAFQMLEHLPFEDSLRAFGEMARVCSSKVVISLPDAKIRYPFSLHLPKFGQFKFTLPRPFTRPREHKFDGEHYWEINKKGFELKTVLAEFSSIKTVRLTDTFIVPEHPYHRFLIFSK